MGTQFPAFAANVAYNILDTAPITYDINTITNTAYLDGVHVDNSNVTNNTSIDFTRSFVIGNYRTNGGSYLYYSPNDTTLTTRYGTYTIKGGLLYLVEDDYSDMGEAGSVDHLYATSLGDAKAILGGSSGLSDEQINQVKDMIANWPVCKTG